MLELKLKDIQTKRVIYQGLEVDVPADTNFMWLRHTDKKTVLLASPKKPVWNDDRKFYTPSSDTTTVAVLEHADLTVEQVKDSLEAEEEKPTEQDLKQLAVVENLIKNLRIFANTLERNVDASKQNPTAENIQALIQHVYAEEGELDTFITHTIEEAEEYGISTNTDCTEEDEDAEDYAEIVKLLASIFK